MRVGREHSRNSRKGKMSGEPGHDADMSLAMATE